MDYTIETQYGIRWKTRYGWQRGGQRYTSLALAEFAANRLREHGKQVDITEHSVEIPVLVEAEPRNWKERAAKAIEEIGGNG